MSQRRFTRLTNHAHAIALHYFQYNFIQRHKTITNIDHKQDKLSRFNCLADLLFDMALKNQGYLFAFAPRAVVWFRPRSNLAVFWRQYRNYALGDGEGLLWTKRHVIRYGTYLVMTPILVLLGLLWNPWWWGLLILGMAVYLRRPYWRLGRMISGLSPRDKISACLWVPLIRVWGDLAKMLGYPMGLPRGFRLRARTQAYLQG